MPRPLPISKLAQDYAVSIQSLEGTRRKVEDLLHRGELSASDTEQVYAGLFLSAFTEFEALIEDVFLGILSGTHSSTLSKRRVKIIPTSLTREILFEGKNYLDWLPMEKHTLKRAERFLKSGKPFALLSKDDIKLLERLHLLRNAVAHKSDSATVKFQASIQDLSLLPQEKTPTGFLRSRPQGDSGFNQYQIAVSELNSVAIKLCA